jgi:hypothetical protein
MVWIRRSQAHPPEDCETEDEEEETDVEEAKNVD